MPTVQAVFDGRTFMPCESVNLPAGTRVEVILPSAPREPTEVENREWQRLLQEIDSTKPYFPTVEEGLAATRKRS